MKKGGKHKIGSKGPMHIQSAPRPKGTHPSHVKMNKAHGTPAGFGPAEGYGEGTTSGIKDDSEDHCNDCMTE